MPESEVRRTPLQLPLAVRMSPDSEPVTMTRVVERDDGSWMVETLTDGGSPMRQRLSALEFRQIVMVDELPPPRRDSPSGAEQHRDLLAGRGVGDGLAVGSFPAPSAPTAIRVDRNAIDASKSPTTGPGNDQAVAAQPGGGAAKTPVGFGSDPQPASVRGLRANPASPSPGWQRRLPVAACMASLAIGGGVGFVVGHLLARDTAADSTATQSAAAVPFGDNFDGGGGGLDGRQVPARSDLQWSVVSGDFSVSAAGVVTGKLTDGDAAIAVLPGGGRVDSVAVSFTETATGSGLLFRYQDDKNYWELVASPTYGTWVLNRVVDGTSSRITTTGFTGGRNAEVVLVGSTIQLWVEGLLRTTVRDPTLSEATTIGIKVSERGTAAALDGVIVNGQ